jgi:hypothetical protein
VGHQGLFFDRLEAVGPATTGGRGAGGRQLVADPALALSATPTSGNASSPRGLYQNRNRTLDPVLGRFLQRDPNASGQVVAQLFCTGVGPMIATPAADVGSRLADGHGLHQYVGSNPVVRSDASGLFIGMLAKALGVGLMSGMNGCSTLEDARRGLHTILALQALLEQYAVTQMLDVEWADDMSIDDAEYTRLGSAAASYHGSPAGSGDGSDDGPMMAGGDGYLPWVDDQRAHNANTPWHNRVLRQYANYFGRRYGAANVWFNEAVRDTNGRVIGNGMRPDMWVRDTRTGRLIIVEVSNKPMADAKSYGNSRMKALSNAMPNERIAFVLVHRDSKGIASTLRLNGLSPGDLPAPKKNWRRLPSLR